MPGLKRYSPLDMNNMEVWNMKFQNLGTAPSSNIGPGSVYYDTATGKLMWRAASTWIDPLARASHTGSQAASTISDLAAVVKAYRLDEFAVPTADVSFGTRKQLNVALGTASTDGANVQNVTNAIAALRLNTITASADVALSNFKITGLADGTAATDAASWGQVQNLLNGTDWKASVRAATTANITLSGTQTVDGVSLAVGERVLVKNQGTASANGIYLVASGAWTRAPDAGAGQLTPATAVFVEEGTVNGDAQFRITTDGAIVVGTTGITWAQIGAATSYTASNGVLLTGNNFTLDPAYGAARKLAFNVGDGASANVLLTHSWNTYDVQVTVYDATTRDDVGCDITRTNLNAVTLGFATPPTINQFRAVITG